MMFDRLTENKKFMQFIETSKRHLLAADLGNTSVVVAYYLLLSLFPLLIAIGNLLPYLQLDPTRVMMYLRQVIPETIYKQLASAIFTLLTQRSGRLLSFSALAALWSASQSIHALQTAMNKSFDVTTQRNAVVARLLSLFVIVLLLVALALVVVVLGFGQMILSALTPVFHFPTQLIAQFDALKWPLTFVVLFGIMCMIFWILPSVRLPFRSVLPGALSATIGWLILSQVFGLYVKYFNAGVASYQIIGSFIVLMLWLNLAATLLILGCILNAVVEEYRTQGHIQEREDLYKRLVKKIKSKRTK